MAGNAPTWTSPSASRPSCRRWPAGRCAVCSWPHALRTLGWELQAGAPVQSAVPSSTDCSRPLLAPAGYLPASWHVAVGCCVYFAAGPAPPNALRCARTEELVGPSCQASGCLPPCALLLLLQSIDPDVLESYWEGEIEMIGIAAKDIPAGTATGAQCCAALRFAVLGQAGLGWVQCCIGLCWKPGPPMILSNMPHPTPPLAHPQ